MNRLSFFASVIALGVGMVLGFYGARQHYLPNLSPPVNDVSEITDGAFRDGLYLGKLAAEHDNGPHVAAGRWSTAADRASFSAGYQRGYSEVLASRAAPSPNRARQAE